MELIMKTDIEKSLPAAIEFNFEEMKAELSQKMEYYNSLVVTEDSIKEAKADKASLNNLLKTLNNNRIAQERVYMQPFKVYKSKIDELIALIKSPVTAIDSQITAFEDKEKQNKLDEITEFYSTNIKNLRDILPLEKILNPKWENKGLTLLSIRQEIIDKILTVQSDLKIIEDMGSDREIQIKDAYLKNLNMSEALAEKSRLEELEKKLDLNKSEAIEDTTIIPTNAVKMQVEQPFEEEQTRDIKSIIYATTKAFRSEMNTLIQKYNLKCEGIK